MGRSIDPSLKRGDYSARLGMTPSVLRRSQGRACFIPEDLRCQPLRFDARGPKVHEKTRHFGEFTFAFSGAPPARRRPRSKSSQPLRTTKMSVRDAPHVLLV